MKRFVRQNWLFLILAFLLPLLGMALAFLGNGIFWNGPTTPLASDAYHQTLPSYVLYSNILHSGSGLLYTFTSGLGLDLYVFSSWHVSSFFVLLTYFFNIYNMPNAVYLITLLKFGSIGLSAFIAFSNMYKKVDKRLVLGISTSFALLSFLTSQNEIPPWQDVFILVPLIIWGLHLMQDENKRVLYYVSLSLLFIINYYFGFFTAIFVTLYFLVRLSWQKFSLKKILDFLLTSFLAGLTALIMLLPVYLDLKANGPTLSQSIGLLTDNSWGLDIFAKNFVGSYDTTQYMAVPMIYAGLLPLVLALCFFFLPKAQIRWRVKLSYFLLLGFIIASFYFQILDLGWQAFHAPNMFLHRYSWVLSLLVVLMALEVLSRFEALKLRWIAASIAFFLLGFIAAFSVGRYSYLNPVLLGITILFLLAYLLLLTAFKKGRLSLGLFAPLLVLFMFVEAGVNGYYQVAGVRNQWNYPSRTWYEQVVSENEPAAVAIQKLSAGQLVRSDNTSPDTQNDGMKFNYNSIGQFSSVRNTNSSSVMDQLGFSTDGDYLNLRYPGNTLLMDSIFGIKYNINASQPSKFGFTHPLDSPANLSSNAYAQSLGIFVPGGFTNAAFTTDNAIANQTALVNQLAKTHTTFFQQFYPTSQSISGSSGDTSVRTSASTPANSALPPSAEYNLTVPANSQCYMELSGFVFGNSNNQTLTISINNSSYTVSTNNSGSFFNLGYFATAANIKVSLSFPNNTDTSFDTPQFLAMNMTTYKETMAKLSANKVTASPITNGARFSVTAGQSGDLFLTIPYDKGWSATVDGKTVSLSRAQGGFMKLALPAGQHTVELHFFPQGLKEGIIAFFSGIALFILYNSFKRRGVGRHRRNRKKP